MTEIIDDLSPHLAKVKLLWSANRATLGFFPEGAFDEYAARKQIIVALDPSGTCIGYLLYRISRMRIIIVHLCSDHLSRGTGLARMLVDELKRSTREFMGIGLYCRRDYAASKVWPRLGFIATFDKPGRGRAGSSLTYWWFDHGHPSFQSIIRDHSIQQKLAVVIDANIFFSLNGKECPDDTEAKSLEADWIQENICLCLTAEIFNEINRCQNDKERKRRRSDAKSYPIITGRDVHVVEAKLRPLFPSLTKPSVESDLRQLAHAISEGLPFFVTKDDELLKMSDQLYENYGVSMIRPADLVTHIDEILREAEYRPVRMAASLTTMNLVKNSDDPSLLAFQRQEAGERKSAFLRRLRSCLADPQANKTFTVDSFKQGTLSLVVLCRGPAQELTVPLFRVAKKSLSPTVARYLILKLILEAAKENRTRILVNDPYISPEVLAGLEENGFLLADGAWLKINLAKLQTASELAEELAAYPGTGSQESEHLLGLSKAIKNVSVTKETDTQFLLRIERTFWPTKIADLGIPTFIVSIKPIWALHLFDETIARQTFFGAKPELILNGENVYYRAKKPKILQAPGRVLWYVKLDSRYPESMHIRACSYLDEVVIDTPKNLFRRFRRLGVYKWSDLLKISKGDPHQEIMAFRFSGTELFSNPIPWEHVQRVLEERYRSPALTD